MKMKAQINLEETPFIDMRQSKKDTHFTLDSKIINDNLPIDQDNIDYKIYSKFVKVEESSFMISEKAHKQIIEDIIKQYRAEFKLNIGAEDSKKFKESAIKNADIVIKYLKENNPKAALIAFKIQMHDKRFGVSIQKLIQIADKTKYPLLMTELQGLLHFNFQYQPNHQLFKKANQYLEYALKTGLPEAFSWKGLILNKDGKGIKAYEMLKNAQRLGYQPYAYKLLGQLFMGYQAQDIKRNLRLAQKYFKKAKQLGANLGITVQQYLKQIQKQKKIDQQRTNAIQSTLNTRSVQLANFLKLKMNQNETGKDKNNFYSVGTTNNFANEESYSLFNPPKIFFVAFSPLMRFPGRHFLVKDQQGLLEYISIYKWDQLPINKLKLLHEVGTKIVLNEYIKKLGAGDQLPVYRVDNPFSIQFYPRTEKKSFSDSQFRNYSKNLFERGLFDQAMIIYEYLVMKNAEQLEIVFSNMGLIRQKQNKIEQAIKFYEKSLAIKPFQKSLIRLATILINKSQFEKAKIFIKEIKTQKDRETLQKEIQKFKQNQSDSLNFKKNIKNKRRVQKQVTQNDELLSSQMSNLSAMQNIREDRQLLIYHRIRFEFSLGLKCLSQNDYLTELQNIYNNIENFPLKKQDAQKFFKMTFAAFTMRFKNSLYPNALGYLTVVSPQLIPGIGMNNPNPESNTVFYMALRQNYLQNRIEDMALSFEEKGKYFEAEEIYRYAGWSVAPFNVKIAELMFLQSKYEQTVQYCRKSIQVMSQFPVQRFFKFLVEITVFELKSLIRLKKYQEVLQKGQNSIQDFQIKNPNLQFQDINISSNSLMNLIFKQQNHNSFKSAQQLIRNIYREIVRALVYKKQITKAKLYLPKISLNKESCNYAEMIQFYYQGMLLQILIKKEQSPSETIKLIDSTLKEVNKEKKLENKQSYIKFMLKLKLSLLILSSKVQETIKQSEEIVKINAINLIFVKEQLFTFMKKNTQKLVELLTKVKQSQLLTCLLPQILQKSIKTLEKRLQNEQNQEVQKILNLIKKFEKDEHQQIQQENEEDNSQHSETISQPLTQTTFEDEEIGDFSDNLETDAYDDEICRFKAKNGLEYIVLFDEKLKQGLEVSEYRKFVCAADHICLRQKGSTGIKFQGDKIRLKIRSSTRLTGQLIQSNENKKTKLCYFNKREHHDDYKRLKK